MQNFTNILFTFSWIFMLIQDVEGGLLQKAKCDATATVGLIVHAAVDGIALGAAATTSHAEVELIIFIAIMLHKVCVENWSFFLTHSWSVNRIL